MESGMSRETHARAQEQRIARAVRESGEMLWQTDGTGWIVTTAAGNSYRVSERACTCHDYQHRCQGTEVRCKHQVALGQKLLAEGPGAPSLGPAPLCPAEQAAFDRIFGVG